MLGGDARHAAPVCVPSRALASTTVTCGDKPNVDLLIDPNNCRACGRRCATCNDGLCPREIVGSNAIGGYVLALTDKDAFVGDTQYVFRSSRTPDAGPAVGLYLFSGSDLARGFAIDGDRLFVAAERGVYELSASGDGSAPAVSLVPNEADYRGGFGQTSTELFWANYFSALVFVQKEGIPSTSRA